MTVQTMSLLVSFAAITALALVFLVVRLRGGGGEDYGPVQKRAYRFRAILFWGMVLVGLPVTVWLLRVTPYAAAPAGAQVVNVTGMQWFWEVDREEVKVGQPVEFNVTSTDVNHGFGLYDDSGQLVAQVQAMPGYVNHLTYTFAATGTYRIFCLEFCGLVHHDMISEIIVSETGETHG